MSKKSFVIEVSVDLLKEKLTELLKKSGESHYKLISKMIMENLEITELGLKELYFAFSGIEEKIEFLPGDEVLVQSERAYNWGYDKEAMVAAGIIDKGMIKANVIGIHPHRVSNIEISYMRITEAGKDPSRYEQSIESKYLKRTNECKIVTPDVGDLI